MSNQSLQITNIDSRPVKLEIILILRAFLKLVAHDQFVQRNPSFEALYEYLRSMPVAKCVPDPNAVERVRAAINEACVWYFKPALCLQRSVVAVELLRGLGVPAKFVYGIQQLPFKAHAWVEVGETVVNDRQDVQKEYCIMERI